MPSDSDRPGLSRRLAAIVYDGLLLWGVLFVAGLPLPLISGTLRESWWVELLTQGYLLIVCLLFFGWFWVHGGQTLGMRAWRLRVVGADRSPIGWRQATVRFLAAALSWAALGLGFLWVLVDRERLAWHDRLSNTALVLLPKNAPSEQTKAPG